MRPRPWRLSQRTGCLQRVAGREVDRRSGARSSMSPLPRTLGACRILSLPSNCIPVTMPRALVSSNINPGASTAMLGSGLALWPRPQRPRRRTVIWHWSRARASGGFGAVQSELRRESGTAARRKIGSPVDSQRVVSFCDRSGKQPNDRSRNARARALRQQAKRNRGSGGGPRDTTSSERAKPLGRAYCHSSPGRVLIREVSAVSSRERPADKRGALAARARARALCPRKGRWT